MRTFWNATLREIYIIFRVNVVELYDLNGLIHSLHALTCTYPLSQIIKDNQHYYIFLFQIQKQSVADPELTTFRQMKELCVKKDLQWWTIVKFVKISQCNLSQIFGFLVYVSLYQKYCLKQLMNHVFQYLYYSNILYCLLLSI